MTDTTKDTQGQGEALTVGRVKAIIERMSAMPAVNPDDRKCTKQEAVAMMADAIKEMLGRGYSFEQVAEFLTTENFLEITAPTLKSYMQRAARKSDKSTKRKQRVKIQQADILADAQSSNTPAPRKTRGELKPDANMLDPEDA